MKGRGKNNQTSNDAKAITRCPARVPSHSLAHPQPTYGGGWWGKKRESIDAVSTVQQEPKHRSVTNTVLDPNGQQCTTQAAMKEVHCILATPGTKGYRCLADVIGDTRVTA